jgi:biopolymer transport protein ExbD
MKMKKLDIPHDPMPNMTAMVDLIMCILIFFMLASKFVVSETFLPSSMPVDMGFSDRTNNAASVEVNLILGMRPGAFGVVVDLPDGSYNKTIPAPGVKPATDEEYLTTMARYMGTVAAELKRRKADLAGKVRVILKPTPDLEYKYIVGVFGAVQDAGFDNICFAVSYGG